MCSAADASEIASCVLRLSYRRVFMIGLNNRINSYELIWFESLMSLDYMQSVLAHRR